jgi:ketosteroid isomerase-like protein
MSAADVQNKNLRIVQTMIENGIIGRWDIVKPYVAEDFVCHVPEGLPYGRVFHGWQGYMDILGEVVKFWTDVSFGPNELAATGDKVVVCSHLKGRIAKNGRAVSMPLAEIWELKDGKVAKITAFYYDTKLIADLATQ